jgi:hypothetical protein
MKIVAILLICLTVTVFAASRTMEGSGSGHSTPALSKGTYTVEIFWDPNMLDSAYGIALQDDVTNSLWISSWGTQFTYEYDTSIGFPTGNEWEITNAIDCDDMAYCEYGSGNQFFLGDFTFSNIGVFDASGVWVKNIAGPATFANIFPIAAGHGMLYVERGDEICWGPYTGTESSVTWTTAVSPLGSGYGMAVWGDYLFACCDETGADNIFIFAINPDGSLNLTPEWSCEFTEASPNGSLDYDGTNLWVYPQNDYVYKLTIDWSSSLENSTWGEIKTTF